MSLHRISHQVKLIIYNILTWWKTKITTFPALEFIMNVGLIESVITFFQTTLLASVFWTWEKYAILLLFPISVVHIVKRYITLFFTRVNKRISFWYCCFFNTIQKMRNCIAYKRKIKKMDSMSTYNVILNRK